MIHILRAVIFSVCLVANASAIDLNGYLGGGYYFSKVPSNSAPIVVHRPGALIISDVVVAKSLGNQKFVRYALLSSPPLSSAVLVMPILTIYKNSVGEFFTYWFDSAGIILGQFSDSMFMPRYWSTLRQSQNQLVGGGLIVDFKPGLIVIKQGDQTNNGTPVIISYTFQR